MSANVFKRGGVWHYSFQVAGKRFPRSTGLTSRRSAETLAQCAYDAVVLRANGGEPVPTLAELVHVWIEVHRPVSSVAPIRSVELFRRLHMFDLGAKSINEITTLDVELARNVYLLTYKPASANHWLRIVRLLTMWAVKRGMLAAMPFHVSMLKVQKRPRSILPLAAARAWFAAVDESTEHAPGIGTAVRLMFRAGPAREGGDQRTMGMDRLGPQDVHTWHQEGQGSRAGADGRMAARAPGSTAPAERANRGQARWAGVQRRLCPAGNPQCQCGVRSQGDHAAPATRHVRHAAVGGWRAYPDGAESHAPKELYDHDALPGAEFGRGR